MTIHFIYVKGDKISTPYAITNEIEIRLKKHYKVKTYNWDEEITIKPNEGDVLLGHPHPWRKTIFRLSMKQKGWKRIISMNPYAHNLIKYVAFIDSVYDYIDTFIAITGEYWYDNMPNGPFGYFYPITTRVDLGINKINFPRIKFSFNPEGKRKFLYIGNAFDAKGTDYLAEISLASPEIEFGWIGNGEIKNNNLIYHGFKNTSTEETRKLIAEYDYLISTGRSDSNPTTILEASAWGLITVCTKECGYYKKPWIINIPLDQLNETKNILNELNYKSEAELFTMQIIATKELKTTYNWDVICNNIVSIINSPPPLKQTLSLRNRIKRCKIQWFNIKSRLVFFLTKKNIN